MQRVIIDTNVIVSSLITNGIPSRIITELVLEKKVALQLSSEVFSEYVEVLARPKFTKIPGFRVNSEIVISRIEEVAIRTEPSQKIALIKDSKDNCFLELALETEADFLITGNWNDFTIQRFRKTIITSPSVYWNEYRPV